MSEHTDGPWRAMPVEEWAAIKADQPSSICHVGEFVIITKNPSYEFHGTCEADANLIAAAPELLSALKKLKWVSIEKDNMEFKCETTCFVVDEIRAAIAKATGETDGK